MATASRSTGVEGDALELELERLLECSICMEPLTDPKVLNCLHTFCKKCLQGVYNNSGRSGNLRCPTCRKQTSVPANGIAELPTDFKMNDMKDMIGKEQTRSRRQGNVSNPSQARPRDNVCNLCEARNQVIPATWRCIDCDTVYCDGCMQNHNSNSIFGSHDVRKIHLYRKCEVRLKLVLQLVGQTVQSYTEL